MYTSVGKSFGEVVFLALKPTLWKQSKFLGTFLTFENNSAFRRSPNVKGWHSGGIGLAESNDGRAWWRKDIQQPKVLSLQRFVFPPVVYDTMYRVQFRRQ